MRRLRNVIILRGCSKIIFATQPHGLPIADATADVLLERSSRRSSEANVMAG